MEQLTEYTIIHINEELEEEDLKDLIALLSMLISLSMKLKFALIKVMKMVSVIDLIVNITLFDEDLDNVPIETIEALRELLINLLANIDVHINRKEEE